jgi:hypothetical protein
MHAPRRHVIVSISFVAVPDWPCAQNVLAPKLKPPESLASFSLHHAKIPKYIFAKQPS